MRDHVFDVLRRRRSCAALGGGDTGRAMMLGLLRQTDGDIDALFDGQGYGPAPLTEAERDAGRVPEGNEAWDLPDWLCARLEAAHDADAPDIAMALRARAPVFLRANLLKTTRDEAAALLRAEGVETTPCDLSGTALEVLEGARRVSNTQAFRDGLIELQDLASQAVTDMVPLQDGARVLDYCAGGGGKSLALAARQPSARIDAHDADARRMSDLPARAKRAGARIQVTPKVTGAYDVVLCDVPCSGSGAWRRSPEGKWALSPDRLSELCRIQSQILDTCVQHCHPAGSLVFVTCSMLAEENGQQVAGFLQRHPGWTCQTSRQFLPKDGGDGFFVAVLKPS